MGRLLDAKAAGAATNPSVWKKDFRASLRMNVTVRPLDARLRAPFQEKCVP
jgi:hypothetical protein